jgi:rhodanese-related sulfurtransferase
MKKISRILEIPPANPSETQQYFHHKLSLETDPADVYADLENGFDGFILVDVRSPDAFARSHARGAINIPHAAMTEQRLSVYPPNTVFIVYCWGPGCNGADKAAYRLSKLGRPVKIMIGGIEYWQEKEGYPVEQG